MLIKLPSGGCVNSKKVTKIEVHPAPGRWVVDLFGVGPGGRFTFDGPESALECAESFAQEIGMVDLNLKLRPDDKACHTWVNPEHISKFWYSQNCLGQHWVYITGNGNHSELFDTKEQAMEIMRRLNQGWRTPVTEDERMDMAKIDIGGGTYCPLVLRYADKWELMIQSRPEPKFILKGEMPTTEEMVECLATTGYSASTIPLLMVAASVAERQPLNREAWHEPE